MLTAAFRSFINSGGLLKGLGKTQDGSQTTERDLFKSLWTIRLRSACLVSGHKGASVAGLRSFSSADIAPSIVVY